MKESKSSLKIFFILIGLYGLWGLNNITLIENNMTEGLLNIAEIIIGGIFLYIGFKLLDKFNKYSTLIKNMLLLSLGLDILQAVYYYSSGSANAPMILASLFLSIVVTLYLFKNITKLSGKKSNK